MASLPGAPAPHLLQGLRARRLWVALGLAVQALVFAGDFLTPLGFAHGVLYAPAVLAGLAARSQRAIWGLALVGIAGVYAGVWASDGRLPGVSDTYIMLNRLLGAAMVVLIAVAASVVVRLVRQRHDASQAMRQAASLLEVSSKVGRLGGWRVDMSTGISHWSDEVYRLLGQPPGDTPDVDTVIACYAPEHQARIRTAFEACVAGGVGFDEELQVAARDGTRRWVRVAGEAVRDRGGSIVHVHGAIQDIDEYKAAQRELERSRAEWRLMAESLPMMVWVSGADGAVTFMNRFTADYTGAAQDELLGSGWGGFLHPDDQPLVAQRWAAALADGQPYEAAFRVRRADGAWRWHYARAVRHSLPAGGEHRWYGTALDVQDRRDEQLVRARLTERLAQTMESVTDAIIVIDDQWRFSYLNAHAETLLERERDALLGRNVWDAFPEARGSVFQQQYERCVRDGVTVRFESEYGPLGKIFEINAYPNDGGVVVYFRDVTELRRLSEQLDQAQRLDSLGQLTGGVAHDFNNLLTVILGNAETLVEENAGDERALMLAEMIAGAARRGAEMTQRLLAFARRQALEPRPVDLNRQARDLAPLLQRTLGEHIDIEMVHAARLWQAFVDPGQLETALVNLAVNARDAMPDGGKLTIETANTRLDEAYAAHHAEVQPGQYVMLAVSDTGTGIAPELLPRIFEPFFTTKAVGKGTGLGLAMVYGFVKQSSGHVAVYSEVGRGTTVKLYLPRLVRAVPRPEPVVDKGADRPGQGQCVLLVEDDELVRGFARRQVEALGYRVLEAADGLEAMRCLAENPDVDLLFTDVVMPGGMSGRQLADAARALRPDLPVLYTSGYTENAIVHQGRLDPGVLLLGKPYLRSELAEKLHQALARKRTP